MRRSNSLVESVGQITGLNLTPLRGHSVGDTLVRLRTDLPPVLAWPELVLAAGCLILPPAVGRLGEDVGGNERR